MRLRTQVARQRIVLLASRVGHDTLRRVALRHFEPYSSASAERVALMAFDLDRNGLNVGTVPPPFPGGEVRGVIVTDRSGVS
jgi:hypothetical protein